MDRKDMRLLYKGESKFNVLITHYDLIMRDKSFLKKINWHYMIIDEGHRLKNRDCRLSQTLVNEYDSIFTSLVTGL
jgi:SWI/SNF-related matrix-associated actin-dependent regulator of chromatin subfamily A protein 2/4